MSNISQKLDAFGLRPLKPFGPFNPKLPKPWDESPDSYIQILEKRGLQLPSDYKTYLVDHPFTVTLNKEVVFFPAQKSPRIAQDGFETLEILFGKCPESPFDLLTVCASAESLMPDFLPIGEVMGANLVYLSLCKTSFGEIYVWDREHNNEMPEGLYFVTTGFSAFVDMLHEVTSATIAARPKPKVLQTEIPERMKKLVDEYKNRQKNQ
jgi:hypothetical protein